jgi:uncharacterized tellurite resistance protein B-like protein
MTAVCCNVNAVPADIFQAPDSQRASHRTLLPRAALTKAANKECYMFQLFKTLLDKVNDGLAAPAATQTTYGLTDAELACVSLMLMVAHADFASAAEELALAAQYVKREFNLSDEHARAVVALADKQAKDAISLHQFTSQLKQLSYEARLGLLDNLWQQAYADAVLDPNEEAMLRKIADLLFIRHSDYIQAKLAVCGG